MPCPLSAPCCDAGLVDLLGLAVKLPDGTQQAFLSMAFGIEVNPEPALRTSLYRLRFRFQVHAQLSTKIW